MSGPITSGNPIGRNLVEILRWRARHQPDRRAYIFLVDGETEEVQLTYRELDRRARAIGAQLQSLGAAGERALLLYPPGLEYIAAFFGCLYAGVVAVPAYPPHPVRLNRAKPRLLAITNDARPLVALTLESIRERVEALFATVSSALDPMRWVATDDITDELATEWREPTIRGDTLLALQYTSGSTAAPKGVMLDHSNLLHNLALIHRCFEHTPASQGVIWLPPYHDMGLIGGVLQPLYVGFPVTLMSPFAVVQRPLRWLQAISRYKATTSGGPNFAYELCVRRSTPQQRETLDLSSWEVAFNGAEPIHHQILEQFIASFEPCGFRREAFYPCYGLAEGTLMVSGGLKAASPVIHTVQSAPLEQNRVIPATDESEENQTLVGCGQSLLDQKILIVDPQSLTQCPAEQVGEIWISGPSVAQGYWNQPELTEYTFRAYLADTGEGPFLRTGDLGFLKEGELFVTGRLKDLIIIGGQNHYPHDIEWTVEHSQPSLRPHCCAAFSVNVDGKEQLVIVAEVDHRYEAVSVQQDVAPTSNRKRRLPLDVNEVLRTIRQTVASYHNLGVYAILLLKAGSIPKTSSGKIQRSVCRDRFLAGKLDSLKV